MFCILTSEKDNKTAIHWIAERKDDMKGYDTASGYMGLIDGRYVLFASEAEYADYMEEEEAA